MAGLLHRTAQPLTLAAFRPWEGSAGAGRVRPASANLMNIPSLLKSRSHPCVPYQLVSTGTNGSNIYQHQVFIFSSPIITLS